MNYPARLGVLAAVGCLLMAGCAEPAAGSSGTQATKDVSVSAAFPVTVKSCGEELTFTQAPAKVIMLSDTDASVLVELGLLDRLVGRVGTLRPDAYDPDTLARLQAVPEIESVTLDTGGAKVSTESIVATGADLVIGYDTGLDRDSLRRAGVAVYSPDAFCPEYSVKKASFDLANQEVSKLANMFGVPEKGNAVNEKLKAQLASLNNKSARGSAAALYVTPGSSTFYAYGAPSMVQPILEANGLTNRYQDQTKRVFDASMEDLLRRDPDYLILLHGSGESEAVKKTFGTFNGAKELTAVRNGHVLVLPFPLTDPPTPTSITGAVTLSKLLEG